MRRLVAIVAVLVALLPLPARAHPHIFVDARATITFNDAGEMVSVHNSWTFDEAYSAWSIQGLDSNFDGKVTTEELQGLADDNMIGLAEYQYYTFAGEGPDNLTFVHGSNPRITYDGSRTTLDFDVALDKPYAIRNRLEVAINDPEYYVAITFAGAHAVQLVNAPNTCALSMEAPRTMPDELMDQLAAIPADVTRLPPELEQAMLGVQGAVIIDCPGGSTAGGSAARSAEGASAPAAEPATALDAATQVADAAPYEPLVSDGIPFGGAPPEPGLTLPRTGFLGWVAQKQVDFYKALTQSLAELRKNWTAFWVLGGLSFLYGVFHSAGPGHGKVVISSYVLANEAQVRRGVLLSFLSAMLQSLVAIGFVLVAALLLNMTSLAMADAANWIGILSYGLIAALGAWLIVRKVFRLGHRHGHAPEADAAASMQALARRHLGAPAHALAAGGPSLTSFATAGGPDKYGRLPADAHYGHSHSPDDNGDDHGHAHVVTPTQLTGTWREQLGVVLAVGMRPCSGALIVLAFALSQGLLAAGIVAVLLMGVGTAITTGALAALAVGVKSLARGLAGADNAATRMLLWWAELLAAFAVFGFGVILLLASI